MKLASLLKIAFLFLCALFYIQVDGQLNFKEGYIIDLKSDTIKGEVKCRKWNITPKSIEFRKDGETGSAFYKPSDIKGFGVSGISYLGVITVLEKSPNKVYELDYAADFKVAVDTVFLEEIAGGSKPVYYHKDYKGKINFLIRSDSGIVPLLYKIFRREEVDYTRQMTAVVKDEEYKRYLYAYLLDCPAIENRIRKMKYELRDFRLLLKEYHSCAGTNRTVNKITN